MPIDPRHCKLIPWAAVLTLNTRNCASLNWRKLKQVSMLPRLGVTGGRALLRPAPCLRPFRSQLSLRHAPRAAVAELTTTAPVEGPAFKANLDFKFVRDNLQLVTDNCRARKTSANPALVAELYEEFLTIKQQTDALRASRNENSQTMKVSKRLQFALKMAGTA